MSRRGEFDVGGEPVTFLSRAANRFAHELGNTRPATFRGVVVNPRLGHLLSAEYAQAPGFDSSAVPHFRAMREETKRQFEFLTGARRHGGLGVDVSVQQTDPYGSAAPGRPASAMGAKQMFRELGDHHLRVLDSAQTGGHPFFTDDENNQFRAVHDAFGHAATGRGVDRHGEEAAYLSHRSMYTRLARPAMATETRGQNSAFIFGSSGKEFQQQKVAVLPSSQIAAPPMGRRARMAQVMQARQFHASMFPPVE